MGITAPSRRSNIHTSAIAPGDIVMPEITINCMME